MLKHSNILGDEIGFSEIKNIHNYKAFLLFLLFAGYSVKQYLNEQKEMEIFYAHLD